MRNLRMGGQELWWWEEGKEIERDKDVVWEACVGEGRTTRGSSGNSVMHKQAAMSIRRNMPARTHVYT